MSAGPRKVFTFILKVISNKPHFFFWLFIRFISAAFPLFTIYLFSLVVRQLEQKTPLSLICLTLLLIFIVRIIDNYLRLKSVTQLEHAISNITFDIHNFFLSDLKNESKDDRHAAIQTIRNFADASNTTLNLIKQPGIDSLVSLMVIPVILFILDFPSFIATVAYILVYYFVDIYTTQKYAHLRDILNSKTEAYYSKLQDTNDIDLEQSSYTRHFHRIANWGFVEWFILQNIAVVFYCLFLLYLIYSVVNGQKDLSSLVLILGYVAQTQVLLNSISQIKDSLTDMMVGLEHLAKNSSVSVISLSDLI